jgi:hypothetical protein
MLIEEFIPLTLPHLCSTTSDVLLHQTKLQKITTTETETQLSIMCTIYYSHCSSGAQENIKEEE